MRVPPFQLGLTARGSALLTAGVTALACGIALGQRDLVRVAVLLIAAPVVAGAVVNRSRLSVASSRSVTPERAAPGQPIVVRIGLRNDALLPTGSLMLEDQLARPFAQRARFTLDSVRGREERSLAYQLPAVGRGRYRVGPLSMRLTDPFGLVERTRSFSTVSEVIVLPTVEPLPDLSLPGGWDSAHQAGSSSIGSHGSDDASIRGYRYGDDLRKVHWRSTARLGSMMVRQEERPWHGRTTLVLDTRAGAYRRLASRTGDAVDADGPRPDKSTADVDRRSTDSFEWAVSATASIAAHLSTKGRALDVVVGATRLSAPRPGALLDQLAVVEATDDIPISESLTLADSAGQESTVIALFGALDERSLQMVTSRHRAAGSALALLIDPPSFSGRRGSESVRHVTRRAEAALTGAGWRVQRVSTADTVEHAWAALLSGRRAGGQAGAAPSASDSREPMTSVPVAAGAELRA